MTTLLTLFPLNKLCLMSTLRVLKTVSCKLVVYFFYRGEEEEVGQGKGQF